MMSLVNNVGVAQSSQKTAVRAHQSEFWTVLALLCIAALALVVASAILAPMPIGSGTGSETFLVGP
jgi:hypothetical protein